MDRHLVKRTGYKRVIIEGCDIEKKIVSDKERERASAEERGEERERE